VANAKGTCLICGQGPTVKAHLIPRALALDVRGTDPNLVEGSATKDGMTYRQNGYWDDAMLCLEHEQQSGRGDKYAIEFIRAFKASGTRRHGGLSVPNPKPEALAHFVQSTVWKTVMSKYGVIYGLSLGPYEAQIRRRVFGGAGTDLPFLVAQHRLNQGSEPARMVIPPYRQKLRDRRVWMFVIGGLQFHLKTDKRPFPQSWEPYLGNDNDPLVLADGPELDVLEARALKPIFDRMMRPRGPRV
jgi:hypothetical protein